MFYFILSIAVNLFIIYSFYKKVIIKISEPDKKEKAEINSLMVEFNKITKNNIDLLEEKVYEVKNVLKLLDVKILEIKKNNIVDTKLGEIINEVSAEDNVINFKPANKTSIIKDLFKEGKSSKEIAKVMGISKAEVELYINLQKK